MRKCKQCGKTKDMRRLVDAKYQIFDSRHNICFVCQFTLPDDDGDLNLQTFGDSQAYDRIDTMTVNTLSREE